MEILEMIRWVPTKLLCCETCGDRPDVLFEASDTVCEKCLEKLFVRRESENRTREIQTLVDSGEEVCEIVKKDRTSFGTHHRTARRRYPDLRRPSDAESAQRLFGGTDSVGEKAIH
jgi:hypothetical protein